MANEYFKSYFDVKRLQISFCYCFEKPFNERKIKSLSLGGRRRVLGWQRYEG